jgi:hypothetical protein
LKRGTPRHPKVAHLRELLRISLAEAVGRLELLWHFTAEFAPQGDIGRFSDERIEAALDWRRGKPGRLLAALIECRWIDRHPECRLCVHDWQDHADQAVRKRLARGRLSFVVTTRSLRGDDEVPTRSLRGDDVVKKSPLRNVGVSGKVTGPPEPEPHPRPVTPPIPPITCAPDGARVGESALAKIPRSGNDRERWFSEFWEKYPRKVAKLAAQKAFKKHVTSEEIFHQVMRGLEAQLPKLTRDLTFCPYPASWLNKGHWNDEPEAPARAGPQQARFNYPELPKMNRS